MTITNEQLRHAIELLREAVKSGNVQARTIYDGDEWSRVQTSDTHINIHSVSYRIKPQPREVWLATDRMSRLIEGMEEMPAVVCVTSPLIGKWIKFREVLDE